MNLHMYTYVSVHVHIHLHIHSDIYIKMWDFLDKLMFVFMHALLLLFLTSDRSQRSGKVRNEAMEGMQVHTA